MEADSSILITGSSGMVGKSLASKLKKEGFKNISLPSSKELNLINQRLTEDFFRANHFDYVFHLAGKIGGIAANVNQPVEFMYENMMMAFNIFNASYRSNVTKLLFLASSCIYPVKSKQPMREDYLLDGKLEPTNEGYALAKISGIKLCQYMNQQYNTNYLCLIPPNLYGFNDHFNEYNSHVISSLIYKLHKAKVNNLPYVEIWGSGSSKREFMFVDDIADAMLFFMNNYDAKDLNNFLNVGSNEEVSILQLSELIKDVIGYEGLLKFNIDKLDGMPNKFMDCSISNSLGWRSKINLKDGLNLTYQWYKENLKSN